MIYVAMDVKIIDYELKYHDSMLSCYMSAKCSMDKNAPREHRSVVIREDLLDIEKYYFDKGNHFWLAVNDDDCVVGMLGFVRLDDESLRLRRFFIKPGFKRCGIGSKLFAFVENHAKHKGITRIYTRFAGWYNDAEKFYTAKGFVYKQHDGQLIAMMKELG